MTERIHNIDQLTEKELLSLIELGDQDGLTLMYKRYNRSLFVYALRLVKDEDDAWDFVHDIFLSVIARIRSGELKVHTSLSALLHQSLRNHIFNSIERTKVADKFFTSIQSRINAGEATTENYILEKETRKKYEASLEGMPLLTREIYQLAHDQHFTYEQISRAKSVSRSTVQRHLREAIRVLQTKLTSIFLLF